MIAIRALAIAPVVLVLCGCSASPPDEESGLSRPSPSVRSTSAGMERVTDTGSTPAVTVADPSTVLKVTASKPIGSIAEPQRTVRGGEIGQEGHQGVSALGEDGTILLSKSYPRTDPEQLGRRELRLLVPAEREPTLLDRPEPAEPRQITGSDLSERWVVWKETASTDLMVEPWVMYSHDRETGKTTEVTRSAETGDQKPLAPPGWTEPQITGDHVVWAEGIGTRTMHGEVSVARCQLPDCPVRETIIEGAAYPNVTSEGVYALRHPGYHDPQAPDDADFQVVFKPASGGPLELVATLRTGKRTTLTGFVTDGELFAWTIGLGPRAALLVWDGEESIRIDGLKQSLFGYPVLGHGFVAWAESSGDSPMHLAGFVYRPARGDLHRVGNASGLYGIEAAGNYLSYQRKEDRTIETRVVTLG